MGYIDVAGVAHTLPDGRRLFQDVSLRVGEGAKVAFVGPSGAGKTALLRMIAGDLPVREGTIARSGGVGFMRQSVGMSFDQTTLEELALGLLTPALRAAAGLVEWAEAVMRTAERRGKFSPAATKAQRAYLDAVAGWGEVGGYEAEVLFDAVSLAVLHKPWEKAKDIPVRALSGGEQKRFALELLLRGADEVLLLDEPDNFLTVPERRWLEIRINESPKTVLFVPRHGELLAPVAGRVVEVGAGSVRVRAGGTDDQSTRSR
ncbi:ABC-F family ATP-binding cassette domain-containing protein [Planosporangium flavigriseum]|uniref:ABC transporter domain-containing protein n=1 Tax=Planosporangium flavigriseum TaxID=373681 RepID=A0A8J3PKY7_9ACTN|nr:ABC-F family ATP-binding cassette domain-containing protein [Planosporangium flavigriseum]GIG72664.1 hypothetical protein Pfl04_10680 [Planosporangium flavigriseum]